MLQDFGYAVRTLLRSRGFTATAVLTLALGIGANTAVFSLVNAVFLRPPSGIQQPGELVLFERRQAGKLLGNLGYPDFLDYQTHVHSISGLVAVADAAVGLSIGDAAQRVRVELVSGSYFQVLGVAPRTGRLIESRDDYVGDPAPPVVLSARAWKRIFGADAGVIGKTILLDQHAFTVAGVAADDFAGTRIGFAPDLWAPLSTQPVLMARMPMDTLQNRSYGWLMVLGRLAPGVHLAQAQAEVNAIANSLAHSYPITNLHREVQLVNGVGMWSDDRFLLQHFLVLLLASVTLLLIIASANVGVLMLARAESRQREIAIRRAMGARSLRLFRQLLAEGLLLSCFAAAAALILVIPTAKLAGTMVKFSGAGLQRLDAFMDWRVLSFAGAVGVACGVLCSLAPALFAFKTSLLDGLKQGSRAMSRRSRAQSALIAIQVASCVVLLAGSGLLLRSMAKIIAIDPGYDDNSVLLLSLDLSPNSYSGTKGTQFYSQLLSRLRSLPAIASASLAATVPPDEISSTLPVFHPGEQPPPAILQGRSFELGLRVDSDVVGSRFFQTMRVPLIRGRDFGEQDNEQSTPVAIVSESLAQRLWPNQNAIGQQLMVPDAHETATTALEIVGVVRDIRYRTLTAAPPLLLWLPVTQHYSGRMKLIVRSNVSAAALLPHLRDQVNGIAGNVPLFNAQTMSQHLEDSLWQQRMALDLIAVFGVLALVVAAIGLFGAVSRSVVQRTHELGIRLALGARREDVLQLVVGDGMLIVFVGVVAGILGSLPLSRALRSVLYGVSPNDPITLMIAIAVLGTVALTASYIPGRKAARIDPIEALRYE